MSIGTKLCFVLLQRYQSDSTIWLQNTFGKFPWLHLRYFSMFPQEFFYKHSSFHTNAPGWCLTKCINYHWLATFFTSRISWQESWQNSCQEFQDFLTVQDNSRSYQGFQEVTGICGKIQDLGKSFKIFYTGCTIAFLNIATPLLKTANFKFKYLENRRKYWKLSARKVSKNFI